MIGVAFFAFSSYVCLAQAKKQEKELAAGPSERKDENAEENCLANSAPLFTQEAGFSRILSMFALGHRHHAFDPLADLIVDLAWPCLCRFPHTAHANPRHLLITKSLARNQISRYLEYFAGSVNCGLAGLLSIAIISSAR
jgi:hypothetical protein